ncbi:non-ribosomal peptide synthetase [Photorhabdus temperata]|uniref:non-ribosomal peptide synthetase n=1 Tax=Photorhabdus temperata TaxID=574560 RepID=UPI00038A24ED|nr:non-ribosomal peptide synthetase [Photorhabdus temperata]EQC00390.1 hypothetical protein B738_11575 [Photorhabdus temperata subsp. temperata M1021]
MVVIDSSTTCADIFNHHVITSGSMIAVRQDAQFLTYQELASRAGAVAEQLRSNGIGQGNIVATLLARSPLGIVVALACWSIGAVYVHINEYEPENRVEALLSIAHADLVVTDNKNENRIGEFVKLNVEKTATRYGQYNPAVGRSPGDIAYLVFTSGSTGTPKVVAIEHYSVLNYFTAFVERIGPLPNSLACTTTFASDLGNTSIFGALLSGRTLQIISHEVVLDAKAFAATIREFSIGLLKCTPSQLEVLATQIDLSELLPEKVLILGGEIFPPRLAGAIIQRRPDLTVFNHYGPSETTIGVLMHKISEEDAGREIIPLGSPLSGVEIRLLDKAGKPVRVGETAELYIGGRSLARGYFGDDELTNKRFISIAGERFFASGDLAKETPHGEYLFWGREDRQLKVRGYRIDPLEIENALLADPDVAQAFVISITNNTRYSIELVACIVGTVDITALMQRLQTVLPASHIPSKIYRVDKIPVTVNGKVDMVMLKSMTEKAECERSALVVNQPHTATEKLITEIWREILGLKDIDINAKFMELGGDSFKSLAVFGKLRRHYPQLTIAILFSYPSISALAAYIDASNITLKSTKVVQL